MDTPITRAEHEEFRKRMEDENKRLDERIGLEKKRLDSRINDLKEPVDKLVELTTAVKELAVNMKIMSKEQEMQGERLKTLESRDGEMWRKVIGYAITAVVGIVVGFVFTQLGM